MEYKIRMHNRTSQQALPPMGCSSKSLTVTGSSKLVESGRVHPSAPESCCEPYVIHQSLFVRLPPSCLLVAMEAATPMVLPVEIVKVVFELASVDDETLLSIAQVCTAARHWCVGFSRFVI